MLCRDSIGAGVSGFCAPEDGGIEKRVVTKIGMRVRRLRIRPGRLQVLVREIWLRFGGSATEVDCLRFVPS